jgi:hypothetical protein
MNEYEHSILQQNQVGLSPCVTCRNRWEVNITTDIKGMEWVINGLTDLAQIYRQVEAHLNTGMKLWDP